jgi:hypothetical protein
VRADSKMTYSEAARSKCFAKMVMCLPLHVINSLLNLDSLVQHVYIVHDLQSPATHPAPGSIPWPILVAATCFSRKHIPYSSKINRNLVLEHLTVFQNKLCWSYKLRNEPPKPNPFGINGIAAKYRPTPVFNEVPPVDIKILCGGIRKVLNKSMCRISHVKQSHADTTFFL